MDERLLTLVQASDLHIGSEPQGSSRPHPALLAIDDIFKGWLDHHFLAVSEFHDAWTDLVAERGDEVALVLSGDLTSTGAAAEFALAADLLGSKPPAGAFGLSLDVADWPRRAVLGNHDHWPGSKLVLGPPALQPNPYVPGPFPIVSELIGLRGGAKIRFVFVDSDADVPWISWDRAMGRGRFASQMDKLERMQWDGRLPRSRDGEVRVMVIHHAISDQDGPAPPGLAPFPRRPSGWKKLEIDGASLRKLETRLVEADIDVVMTGHTHGPRLTEMLARSGKRRRRVFETRCGTTTQQDDAALLARTAAWPPIALPTLDPNTFLLHELLQRDGRLVWATEVFWRSDAGGFGSGLAATSSDGPRSLRREFML